MEQTNPSPKRPTFLTVLCILSFIGSGLGIIMGIYHLATAGATQTAMEMLSPMGDQIEDEMSTAIDSTYESEEVRKGMDALGGALNQAMESAAKMAKYAYVLAGVEIVSNLIVLLGALMMWKLKKTGYYAYVVGQVVGVGTPIALVGFGGIFGGVMMLFAIFPIAFIIMYGLNLKHMN